MTTNDGPSAAVPPQPTPVAQGSPPVPAASGHSQIRAMQALAYFVGLHPTLSALDFTITRLGAIVSRVGDDVAPREAAMTIDEYGAALASACGTTFHARKLQTGPWEWTELRARLSTQPAEPDAPTVAITIAGRRWAVQNPYQAVGVGPPPSRPGNRAEVGEPRR